MAIVYISLGSNKGDRIGYVQQAASLLGMDEGISIVRSSAFYETEEPSSGFLIGVIVNFFPLEVYLPVIAFILIVIVYVF